MAWVVFGQDTDKPVDIVDSNQVLVKAGEPSVLIDPGGRRDLLGAADRGRAESPT